MEVAQVLHMNGGHDENSYAKNARVANIIHSLTKAKKQAAAVEFFSNFFPESLNIADLGCSSGQNALLVVSDIIEAVKQSCYQLGRSPPDFQLFLNDLFKNDFNNVFSLLPDFYNNLGLNKGAESGNCFVYGAPGSFYGRLFPSRSLHFVHSSTSLHWLSQVPKLENEAKVQLNKGNVYISKTSPPCVKEAYLMQFQSDFSLFLKCRAEELVAGGRMVLTAFGRRHPDPASRENCYQWELLTRVLLDLASEGLVSKEKIDTFNIPFYAASPEEMKEEITKEGSFAIDTIESFEASFEPTNSNEGPVTENLTSAEITTKVMRAVHEPLLVNHFGEEIMDELFKRYHKLFEIYFSRNKAMVINVLISLVKKPSCP